MLNKLKTKSQGFTIVEVMIVLAIAGLIILIVLLAVPALQRGSRNASIKNDASAVAGAINEYTSSYNGRQPTDITCADGKITVKKGSNEVQGKVQATTTCDTGAAVPSEPGSIVVAFGKKCNDEGNGPGADNARAAAVLYATETSSGTAGQCLES